MMHSSTTLWAIDPFADKRTQLKVAQHLKEWVRHSHTIIDPTSVLNPGQLQIHANKTEALAKFKMASQKALEKITQGTKLPNLEEPSFVFCDQYSQRKSVETFLAFAREQKAEMIALGTHARTGMKRWLLGSFAEALILQSTIPLLIINPKSPLPKKIKTVLFPTDLSEASENGLNKLLPHLKRLKAKIIFFHKMDYVLPETYSMIYHSDLYEKYLKEDEDLRLTTLKKWKNRTQALGVDAEIIFDDKPNFIPESIIKAAKKHKVQLIALVSHTSPTSAALLGSISRQVVRNAECPVWSWHTSE